MTKRMFFTDPVKALYMMREFGVKLSDYDQEDLKDLLGAVYDLDIEVRDESEHIFEPKDEDIAIGEHEYFSASLKRDEVGTVQEYRPKFDQVEISYPSTTFCTSKYKIIMRDNKHFFSCEVEND